MNEDKIELKSGVEGFPGQGLQRLERVVRFLQSQAGGESTQNFRRQPFMDAQELVMAENLRVLKQIHFRMVLKRFESGLGVTEFAYRLGVGRQQVIEIETELLEAPLWLFFLYLMGTGELLCLSNTERADWHSLPTQE